MSQILPHCLPLVRAGDPDVIISPVQSLGNGLLKQDDPGSVHVRIDGPQTSLTADLITGVFPAPGSEDSPDEFLPHVVLSRRTLPWERRGPDLGTTTPWLALLVFSETELKTATQLRQAQTTSVERRTVSSIPELVTRTRLTNTLGIPGSTEVSTLRVPNSLLGQIMPTRVELGLLCHVKRETVDDVHVDHAIVVANRLPNASAPSGEKSPVHLAVLVSVEQAAELFPPPATGQTTLIVLHHWTFRPNQGGDFEQVVRSIAYRPNGGVQRFGNIPVPVRAGGTAPLSGGFRALVDHDGFFLTALEHDQDVTAATYRGPLRPFGPQSRSKTFAIAAAPNEFTDQSSAKPLDFSHAAAFELGRFLGLNDPAILEDLRGIRGTMKPLDPPVAVNKLPPALQKPDWVVDPAWIDQPWQDDVAQSLVKDETQLLDKGIGDVSGLAEHLPQWNVGDLVDTVSDIGAVVAAPVTSIDLGTVTADALDLSFADIAAAAQE